MKYFFPIIIILIVALLIDSVLSDISSFVNQLVPQWPRTVLFTVLVGIVAISGILIIRRDTELMHTKVGDKVNVLLYGSRIVRIIQYSTVGLLVFVALQIIFSSQYYTLSSVSPLAISWTTGVVLMAAMSVKFLQWYIVKKSLLVVLYFISSILFCSTLGSTIIPHVLITIQTSPSSVNASSLEVQVFQANPQSLTVPFAIISIANWLVIPLSLVIWAATAVMLSHYSKIFGRLKYWLMLSAPLLSIVIGDVSLLVLLPSINTIFDEQVILFTMMAFGGMLAEGFLLAFAFITVSKTIRKNNKTGNRLNDYLDVSARGIILLFVSFFANPSPGSYLPFGIIAASFFSFGAYLFFSGIYLSAISIASDSRIRKAIRKSLFDEAKLLDDIGFGNMYQELDKRTQEILKKYEATLRNETGVDPSITEFDAKSYAQEVITEIQKAKSEKNDKTTS